MPIANPPVDVVTIAVFLFLVTLASYFLGQYLAAVFSGKLHWNPMIRLEKALFYFIDTSTDHEDSWQGYARDLLIFNAIGFCILFLVLIIQGILPLNPQHVSGFPLSQALN
ncbi:MAG TPA: potassium-transporting ATPase subunit KdpA, partial [Methanoregulaceae archaeon]|nr:potassium-transporting ATPase subunit KdpA [Methanoregulaceae archaeon]